MVNYIWQKEAYLSRYIVAVKQRFMISRVFNNKSKI